ncbi:MAG: glycerol-3-phosphate 1-O-acyltransferase PlsY [Alphaproteobacteria bacterium]
MPTQIALDHGLTGLLISAGVAYLLGSIPFGLILTRMAGAGDLRAVGSGNIGATNVLRTGHKGLAAATLVLDAGKGAAAVLLAMFLLYAIGVDLEGAVAAAGGDVELADVSLSASAAVVAALFAVLGHMFPVWIGFRGGKGVATGLGCYLALSPVTGPACLVVWLLGALISRYSSVGALLTFLAAPFLFYLLGPMIAAPMALVIMVLVWIRHWENIRRLVRGEESRINLGGGTR